MTNEEKDLLLQILKEIDPEIEIDQGPISVGLNDSLWIRIKENHEVWIEDNTLFFNDRNIYKGTTAPYYVEKELDLSKPDADPVEWLRIIIEELKNK